jgi:DNA replication and repair protein RecF
VSYRASLEEDPGEDLEFAMRRRLGERRRDELVRRTTLVGPHRDELELAVGEMTARRFASHGESWAGALCLRLGLWGAVGAEIGEPPVLLLDDPFSGLDPGRRRRLAEGLTERGQVLVAVPDEAQVPGGATVWEVEGGRVRPR